MLHQTHLPRVARVSTCILEDIMAPHYRIMAAISAETEERRESGKRVRDSIETFCRSVREYIIVLVAESTQIRSVRVLLTIVRIQY